MFGPNAYGTFGIAGPLYVNFGESFIKGRLKNGAFMQYPKVKLKSSIDVKQWWSGDKRVEPFMSKVAAELDKTGLPPGTKTSIYNRCYEAVYEAIREYADGRQKINESLKSTHNSG